MSCKCGIFKAITGHNISAYQIESRQEHKKLMCYHFTIGFCDLPIMTLSVSSQMSQRCRIMPEIKLLKDSHVCNLFEKIGRMKVHDRRDLNYSDLSNVKDATSSEDIFAEP